MTTLEIDELVERNDVASLQALAEKNGMADQRFCGKHTARWDNIGVAQFARIAAMVWGGNVANLPGLAVYVAAQRLCKKTKEKQPITCVSFYASDGGSTYWIGLGGIGGRIMVG